MPHPPRRTKSPRRVSLYATPIRGAKLACVVFHNGAPEGARASCAGLSVLVHAARVVLPRADGAGFHSHRNPYVMFNLGVIFQVSCPYSDSDCTRKSERALV